MFKLYRPLWKKRWSCKSRKGHFGAFLGNAHGVYQFRCFTRTTWTEKQSCLNGRKYSHPRPKFSPILNTELSIQRNRREPLQTYPTKRFRCLVDPQSKRYHWRKFNGEIEFTRQGISKRNGSSSFVSYSWSFFNFYSSFLGYNRHLVR